MMQLRRVSFRLEEKLSLVLFESKLMPSEKSEVSFFIGRLVGELGGTLALRKKSKLVSIFLRWGGFLMVILGGWEGLEEGEWEWVRTFIREICFGGFFFKFN